MVGVEIKRELVAGELKERQAAILPVVAAIGGMLVPAAIYLAFNPTGRAARGWGVPMATDIAFAVAVLSVIGRRLPSGLKAFLLALAVVDDIGAIVVIGLFYSGQIAWQALLLAAIFLAGVRLLHRVQVRAGILYAVLGLAAWAATSVSGIHPTIAGVALGLLTPAVITQSPRAVSREARRIADQTADRPDPPDADVHLWLGLGKLSRQAVSPLARLEHLLHPWSSYLVVPLFALANAGVLIRWSDLSDAASSSITLGIVLGLIVGKPLGITTATWMASRTGIARPPAGASWPQVAGVGAVAGIGFTVSLFITDLAFGPAEQGSAKVAILVASLLAGAIGILILTRPWRQAFGR